MRRSIPCLRWKCGLCQSDQYGGMSKCRSCGADKAQGTSRVVLFGDWRCGDPACNFNNFARRTTCHKCSRNKPEQQKPQPVRARYVENFPKASWEDIPQWRRSQDRCQIKEDTLQEQAVPIRGQLFQRVHQAGTLLLECHYQGASCDSISLYNSYEWSKWSYWSCKLHVSKLHSYGFYVWST
jgi:hypothetical protein